MFAFHININAPRKRVQGSSWNDECRCSVAAVDKTSKTVSTFDATWRSLKSKINHVAWCGRSDLGCDSAWFTSSGITLRQVRTITLVIGTQAEFTRKSPTSAKFKYRLLTNDFHNFPCCISFASHMNFTSYPVDMPFQIHRSKFTSQGDVQQFLPITYHEFICRTSMWLSHVNFMSHSHMLHSAHLSPPHSSHKVHTSRCTSQIGRQLLLSPEIRLPSGSNCTILDFYDQSIIDLKSFRVKDKKALLFKMDIKFISVKITHPEHRLWVTFFAKCHLAIQAVPPSWPYILSHPGSCSGSFTAIPKVDSKILQESCRQQYQGEGFSEENFTVGVLVYGFFLVLKTIFTT